MIECREVEVEHVDHWRDGNTGKYFHFSEPDFDQLLGKKHWTNEKFDVVQKGSQLWYGKIIVWKGAKTSGAHGRRDSGSAAGQWVTGDTIELQSCQGKSVIIAIKSSSCCNLYTMDIILHKCCITT